MKKKYNREIRELFVEPDIVWVIRGSWLRWAGHVKIGLGRGLRLACAKENVEKITKIILVGVPYQKE